MTHSEKWRPELHPWRLMVLLILALTMALALYMVSRWKMPGLVVLPLGILFAGQLALNYRPLIFLLLASVPLSVNMELGSLSADLPSEPIMWLLTGIFLLNGLAGKQFSLKKKIRPFHVLIFTLFFWTLLTTLLSGFPVRSYKFLMAKAWYLIACVYMAEKLILEPGDVKRLFWSFFIPLLGVVFLITLWHAQKGFAFEESHTIVIPFFANGVIYGATLALFIPFACVALFWYSPKSLQWYVILGGILLLLVGIVLCFKRGAWLAVGMLPFLALLIWKKYFIPVTYGVLVILLISLGYLLQENRFYRFAPTYEQTIWHEGDLGGHLEATFEGKEISSMERFYRWVAAKNMIADLPVFGSGPSTFNQVYKRYADDAFRTYVSDNPEQSTTHNYFLMTFAEQGWVGGGIFVILCLYMLLKGARLIRQTASRELRLIAWMASLSLCTILFHSLLNEMIEVDKVGVMFWICLVLIHKVEIWDEKNREQSAQATR